MTRTNAKYTRIYTNGYDLSGDVANFGSMGFTHEAPPMAAYTDAVVNTVLGQTSIQCGPLNAFLSPSAATGIHELLGTGNLVTNVMIAIGTLAAPAVGDPVFAWTMQQAEYKATGEGVVGVNVTFPNAAYSTVKGYELPFGKLLHAKGAETDVNSAVATVDNGAASTKGGIFIYQLFSSNGTCTLSLDEGAANTGDGDFAALTGATSGEIDASTTPKSGMVALATTATVKRYLRWQLALNSATTATFALAFIRGV